MLISRYVTLFLVPVAFILSWFNMIPISFYSSIISAFFGFFSLFFINYTFRWYTHKNGIGEGDFDLLCFIGAFTGIFGCWASLTIGSLLGSLFGLISIFYTHYFTTKAISKQIPFGPFLAIGAIIYIFYQSHLYAFIS